MNEPARFCTACGTALAAGARFCGQCGAPVAAAPTPPPPVSPAEPPPQKLAAGRRHAIILFCDIAGYTPLSQRLDAEDVHALLARYFDIVDQLIVDHGGHVDKHIGDAVMAVFGAPVAHDNDALRAATAALEIHKALSQLDAAGEPVRVRIGIAGGAVVADETGSARHREYTVTGEAVNLAARLQALAAPAETLIDATIEAALGQQAETDRRDAVEIKGFDKPMPVWRLQSLRAATSVATPFVGRAAQLGQLVGALEACQRDSYGQTIVVRGEAGMGKTRIVEEFRRRADAAGFQCVTAHVLDFGAGVGADPIRQLAHAMLSIAANADEATRKAAIANAIRDGIAEAEMESFLHDLLNLAQPPALQPIYDAMSPSTRAAGRARAVGKLSRRLAQRQPLLVVVEDAHWADSAMLGALARLARRMAECPGLLLMTSRLEGDPFDRTWRSTARNAALMMVDLPPLRREEAATLAAAVATETGGIVENCVARADGNPLFLVQLLKNASTASADLPGTVQSLAQARMDRLDPGARAVLQVAAASGQRFPIQLLRAINPDADKHCATLVDELFLRREGDGYMFAHALIRDGIYASLLKPQRRAIHAPIATWYKDRDLALYAEHLERAEDPAAPAAYLAAAASRAAALQPDEALALVRRGVPIAKTNEDRRALALKEAELLHDLGQGRDAMAAYRLANELADTDEARCRALIGIAAAQRLLSQGLDAIATLEEAEPIATRLGDDALLGQLFHLRGNLCFSLGRAEACMAAHQQALAMAQRSGDAVLEARAYSGLGDADYAVGRWHSAADSFRRCVALAEQHGRLRISEPNRIMLGHCLVYAAEMPEAERHMRHAAEAIRPLRDSYLEMFADESLGFELVIAGRRSEANALLERGMATAERVGARRYLAAMLLHQSECVALNGDRAKARSACDKARDLIDEGSFGFIGPALYGYTAFASDDPLERDRLIEEGEARLGGTLAHNLAYFYRIALEARLGERNRATVDAMCDRYLAFCPEGEPPRLHRLIAARARALAIGFEDPVAGATAYAAAKSDLAAAGITMADPIRLPAI